MVLKPANIAFSMTIRLGISFTQRKLNACAHKFSHWTTTAENFLFEKKTAYFDNSDSHCSRMIFFFYVKQAATNFLFASRLTFPNIFGVVFASSNHLRLLSSCMT